MVWLKSGLSAANAQHFSSGSWKRPLSLSLPTDLVHLPQCRGQACPGTGPGVALCWDKEWAGCWQQLGGNGEVSWALGAALRRAMAWLRQGVKQMGSVQKRQEEDRSHCSFWGSMESMNFTPGWPAEGDCASLQDCKSFQQLLVMLAQTPLRYGLEYWWVQLSAAGTENSGWSEKKQNPAVVSCFYCLV